ncbi:hypothetical protein D3C84_1285130 [compost metagenome]
MCGADAITAFRLLALAVMAIAAKRAFPLSPNTAFANNACGAVDSRICCAGKTCRAP